MTWPELIHFSFTMENTEITFYYQKNLILDSYWYAATHMHPLHELFVMIDEDAEVYGESSQSFTLRKNDVCIVPPRYVHRVKVEQGNPKRVALWFTYKKIKRSDTSFDFFSLIHGLSVRKQPVRFRAGETMVSMLVDIISSTEENKLSKVNEIKLRNIFSLLFIHLAENLPDGQPVAEEQYPKSKEYYLRLALLNHTVHEWLYRNGTVEELAKSLYISARQLSNIFRDEFGMSVKSYNYFLRMHSAAYRLVHTEESITDIACHVGYASSEIFAIMFKRYFGISATQYRKLEQKKGL